MTLELNMNLGIFEDLRAEFEHLEIPGNFFKKGENDRERVGLISSSLLVVSNLSEFWKEREDILEKVMKVIDFMRNNGRDMGRIGREDKLVVCLVLTLIKKYAAFLGSDSKKKSEEIGKGRLKLALEYVFCVMNDKNVSNSVIIFLNFFSVIFFLSMLSKEYLKKLMREKKINLSG